MRTAHILVLALIVALVGATAAMVFYSVYYTMETQVLRMDLEVNDRMGINLNNDSIHLGTILRGGASKREIGIRNIHQVPVTVSISTYGNVSQFVTVSENEFPLATGETRLVTFYAQTPMDAEYGNYTGYAKIVFRRKI